MASTSILHSTGPVNSPMPSAIHRDMHRDSPAYMSPRSSPSLSFGSPSLSQGNTWMPRPSSRGAPGPSKGFHAASPVLSERPLHQTHLLPPPLSQPSPPQNEHTFAHTSAAEYSGRSLRGPPLSPPASDGFLSPHNGHQDYREKIPMDPHLPSVWMTNALGMRAEESEMTLPLPDHSSAPSPPTLFIEDILRAEDPQTMHGISPGYLDEHGFAEPPMDELYSSRRDKNRSCRFHPYPSPYPTDQSDAAGTRARKKRHLTDPSEANYNCKKCGKYFSRIWNYNAHLETHDPDRPRPHVCPEEDCGKSFVRRTDLTRHTQCVHDKAKKFRCQLCHNTFARKDTLRRHEDDGCPKRVDIVSRNARDKPLMLNSQALNLHGSPPPYRDDQQQQFGAPFSYDPQIRSPQYQDPSILPPLSDVLPMQRGNPVMW